MEQENINGIDTVHDRNLEIGERLFELRDYTPIPLILLMFVVAKPTVATATLGTLIMVFGECFRIYSVAFIGSISRTRSSSTGARLITEGPFSWFRNPLYVGNFFIVLGISTFAGRGWLVALSAILFAVQYYFIVIYEETILEKKFGQEYVEYKKTVPAWFPKKLVSLDEIQWPDSFSASLRSERRTLTAIAFLLFFLALKGA